MMDDLDLLERLDGLARDAEGVARAARARLGPAPPAAAGAAAAARPPKRADVLRLGQRDPVVGACVAAWRSGDVTWEEALAAAVVELVKWADRAKALMEETARRAPSAAGAAVAAAIEVDKQEGGG